VKQYKLIKKYPGSRELGIKVSPISPSDTASKPSRYTDMIGREYGWHEVEDYPEYWEPVKEPQFKVGDWIYQIAYRFVDRICEVNNEGRVLMDGHNDITNYWNPKKLRLATPQEIETHLIAEAKKRGYAQGQTIKRNNFFYNSSKCDIPFPKDDRSEYKYSPMSVSCQANQDGLLFWGIFIYQQGQWAEIVKEEPIKIGEYEVKFGNDGDSKFVSVGCKHYSYQEICGLYDACLIFDINQIYAHNHIVETNLIQKIHKELCR